jgi:hypothetical protein
MPTDIRKLTAGVFEAKCSSLQHLALIRLASQSDWCDPLEIDIPANVVGPLRVKGLVDMLPRDRFHPPRYRISAAGRTLLSEKGMGAETDRRVVDFPSSVYHAPRIPRFGHSELRQISDRSRNENGR